MIDIKEYIKEAVKSSFTGIIPQSIEIELEIPRAPSFGDLSTNIAFRLSPHLKSPPLKIAEDIVKNFPVDKAYLEKLEVAGGGYINFTFSREYLICFLREILKQADQFGSADLGKGKRVCLEFVSANPTGPLNIVSARAAALGDSLKRILNKCGYRVESEFYVNNYGQQIFRLAQSLLVRYWQLQGEKDMPFPEDGYHGSYMVDIARKYKDPPAISLEIEKDSFGKGQFRDHMLEDLFEHASAFAINSIVEQQKQSLSKYGVLFDNWIYEDKIQEKYPSNGMIEEFKKKGFTEEREGATYLKCSLFVDDEDRVLKKSDGHATYFLSDIAYHKNKYERDFDWLIDIWGPDHHGYIPRMKAALKALGYPEDSFTVIIAQQVNLIRGGERVKMSKRAGEMITMDDLIEEVGVDAARFFFLQRKPSAHLDFDLDLAIKQTEENPVFYVQYAHARISSIERLAKEQSIPETDKMELLQEEGEFKLIRKLLEFPSIVEICARSLDPQRITVYLQELASTFHSFYQKHRVVTSDRDLSSARLALCRAVKIALKNGLELLGVSAPERM